MTEGKEYNQIVKALLVVILSLLFLRFFPAMWGGVLVCILLVGGIFGVQLLINRLRSTPAKASEDEFTRQIRLRIRESGEKADHYRSEAEEIARYHRQLFDQMERTNDPGPEATVKAEKILAELDAEQALRLSKANFFDASQRELEELLERYRLHQQLLDREADLERLRSGNYEDVAEIEKIRYQLDLDRTRLSTITELTHRAAVSPDLNDTEKLRLSLEQDFRPGK